MLNAKFIVFMQALCSLCESGDQPMQWRQFTKYKILNNFLDLAKQELLPRDPSFVLQSLTVCGQLLT